MKIAFALFLSLPLLWAFPVFGCSFGGTWVFEPTLERWEQQPGPKYYDEKAEGDYWERVPTPNVQITKIVRGSASPGASCDDAGVLYLEVSLPESASYPVDQFGVYFRVVSGKLPDAIFPDVPVAGDVEDGKMTLVLPWLDGHPRQQIPLDLKVEVFLVTNSLNIGPSSTFLVKAGAGKL